MKRVLYALSICMPLYADVSCIAPDFDVAMRVGEFCSVISSPCNIQELGVCGSDMMDFFRALYRKNRPDTIVRSNQIKIPKILHQIWIGKSLPEELKMFAESWEKYHPDWQYKLWTQEDIPQMNLRNRAFIEQSRNAGEISDLMRYEILYQYGGVYLDTDFECLRSLEPLHYLYDFYIGIQPLDSGLVQLGIGIIGAIPGHPILHACIEQIKNTWQDKNLEKHITARTGPIHCTKIFYAMADKSGLCDVALPPTYFYPLYCQATECKRIEWVLEGAFAVHHWAKTWLYPSFRKPEFRTIKNY